MLLRRSDRLLGLVVLCFLVCLGFVGFLALGLIRSLGCGQRRILVGFGRLGGSNCLGLFDS